jgi:predicted KAP-like P-loop ATPase
LFDKYFTLSVADDDLTQAELDLLLANRADPVKFCVACEALQARGLIKLALERLEAYKEETPLDQMEPFAEALCNIGDDLPEKEVGLFEISMSITIYRLIYFGLKREGDLRKRFLVLRNAFSRCKGLSLCMDMTRTELRDRNGPNKPDSYEFLVEEPEAALLKAICLDKVRFAAQGKMLKQNPKLKRILYDWWSLGTPQEVKDWVMSHVQDGQGALWLLCLLLGESHSWGGDHRISYGIQLDEIERFADLPTVIAYVAKIKVSPQSKRETRALEAFNRALARRKAGRSDDPWTSDDRYSEVVDDSGRNAL